MNTEATYYEADGKDVMIVVRGREEWRNSVTRPYIVGEMTCEFLADLLNDAYARGRAEQREDIRTVLGCA